MATAEVHRDTSGRCGPGRASAAQAVGVEEEFLLQDPGTGAVVARAPEVIG